MRRLRIFVLITAAFFLLLLPAMADDFDTARNNQLEILAGPAEFSASDPAVAAQLSGIDSAAKAAWQSMETATNRTELWKDLPFPDDVGNARSAHITATYGRLKAMALAYATHGTALHGRGELLAAILDGLTWMNAKQYTSATAWKGVGNWWDWQIGAPLALNDTMVLLYPRLSPAQISAWVGAIRHFVDSPFGTGANLMWTAEIVSLSGVLIKNGAQVSKGVARVPSVLAPVTAGDGFYADGSFIQHFSPGYAYTGGYGLALMSGFIDFATVYARTRWAMPSSAVAAANSYLFRSFEPVVYKGEVMDNVRGREISRWRASSHASGRKVIAAFLHSMGTASAADAARLRSTAKYWLQTDTTYSKPTDGLDVRTALEAEALLRNSSVAPMAEPTGFTLFSAMDRVVYRRPGWGAALSMFSTRRADYESINAENLKGWHTGDGMLSLYNADLQQYSGNYWPTVDSYLLEGTTVEASTPQPPRRASSQSFVGGVPSWDGAYGAAVMAIAPPMRSLTGKKAWFFLNDQIVCLGADITSASSAEVDTVIANRKLTSAGTNTVTRSDDGSSRTAPVAEPAPWQMTKPLRYLHIAGNVAGSDVGYYFPTPVTLRVMREARSHAWSEINQNVSSVNHNTLFTNNYYTAVLSHGVMPKGASYAYAVLPDISAASLASYSKAPEVSILENSGAAQAIFDARLGVSAAIFWQARSHTVGSGSAGITSDAPSAVFVTNKNGNLEIAVTDPTQTNPGTINISLGQGASRLIDSSPAITVKQLAPVLRIAVNVAGLHGQPAKARFHLAAH